VPRRRRVARGYKRNSWSAHNRTTCCHTSRAQMEENGKVHHRDASPCTCHTWGALSYKARSMRTPLSGMYLMGYSSFYTYGVHGPTPLTKEITETHSMQRIPTGQHHQGNTGLDITIFGHQDHHGRYASNDLGGRNDRQIVYRACRVCRVPSFPRKCVRQSQGI